MRKSDRERERGRETRAAKSSQGQKGSTYITCTKSVSIFNKARYILQVHTHTKKKIERDTESEIEREREAASYTTASTVLKLE